MVQNLKQPSSESGQLIAGNLDGNANLHDYLSQSQHLCVEKRPHASIKRMQHVSDASK
jgi:hypothetical protein